MKLKQQNGVALIIALITLVAMTMTGIVLFRQIGTGVLIAGNLAFQQAAVAASDRGLQSGLTWVTSPPSGFSTDNLPTNGNAGYGYYFPAWCYSTVTGDTNSDGLADDCSALPAASATRPTFNPYTFNWSLAAATSTTDANLNEVRYVIHRMCQTAGGVNAINQQCITVGASSSSSTKGSATYGGQALVNTVMPFYRITTRVVGVRGTTTFTQAIVY